MRARDRLVPTPGAAPRVPRWLGFAAFVLSLALLARVAWRDAPTLAPLVRELRPLPALGALAATLLASALVVAIWRGVLARLGLGLPAPEALAILSLTYLSRYIPGAVWSFAAVGYLGRRRAIPYRAGAFSLLLVLALQGLAALPWLLPVAGRDRTPGGGALWPILALLGGLGLAACLPPTLRRLARPLGLAGLPARVPWWGTGIALAGGGVGYWVLTGLASALLLGALGATVPPLPSLIGVVALAWLGGLLGSFAPAGLGVQDAALVLLLGTMVPPAAALGVALGTRLLKTLNDALYGGLGLALYRRLGLGDGDGVAGRGGAAPGGGGGG